MFLPELCVRRPVLATVLSLAILLIGFMAYERLTVREYPNIDTPVVSVRTVYPGASAEIIESQVTKPLEDSLSGIEGIKTIKSVSREEVSQITVELVLQRDVDDAANDVRDGWRGCAAFCRKMSMTQWSPRSRRTHRPSSGWLSSATATTPWRSAIMPTAM